MADLSTPAFLSLDVTPSYFNGNETVVKVRWETKVGMDRVYNM
jgi:hypothetical protein